MSGFSEMQLIKRRLYAMRNGVLADSLRKSGCPYRLIFGVNILQLSEIAKEFEPSVEISNALFEDAPLRESFLLATMLYPLSALNFEKALEICKKVKWTEDADILCFKLLRKARYAERLAAELCNSDNRMSRYIGLRLWFNIIQKFPNEAYQAANEELKRNDAWISIASLMKDKFEDMNSF